MWRNPKIVPKDYQSTVMEVRPLLVAVPNAYPQPVPGYYLAIVGEWRIVGSPSNFTDDIVAWHSIPAMPTEEDITWRKR